MTRSLHRAAYGGPGWSPRAATMEEEIGRVWHPASVADEFSPLKAVLLHRPGAELQGLDDPDEHLMLEAPDPEEARRQHEGLADAYRARGVEVTLVDPAATPPPNQMFCADLFVMTPAGAVLGRPASRVRAGEERWIARRLADLGVPILRSVGAGGTFEGADACWLDRETLMVGVGLRTNAEGASQVAAAVAGLGVTTLVVDLAHSSMHLMGDVRIVDRDLAFVRRGRFPWSGIEALEEAGYEVRFFADEETIRRTFGHNFVVLGPRTILMPAGDPESEALYRDAGVETVTVEVGELAKCAGSVGCLTGVLHRERRS